MDDNKEVLGIVTVICVIAIVIVGVIFSIYRIHAWYSVHIWKQIGVYAPHRTGYVCELNKGCWSKRGEVRVSE